MSGPCITLSRTTHDLTACRVTADPQLWSSLLAGQLPQLLWQRLRLHVNRSSSHKVTSGLHSGAAQGCT